MSKANTVIMLAVVVALALVVITVVTGGFKEPAYKRTTEYDVYVPKTGDVWNNYDYAIISETAIHNGYFTVQDGGYYRAFVIINKSDRREVVVSKILSECNRKTRFGGIEDNGCIDAFLNIYNSVQPRGVDV